MRGPGPAAESALQAADEAGRSDALENLARVGLVAYGLVHLLVAWLALQLAWGGSTGGERTDQSGALATLAQHPLGAVLLWVIAVGLVALAAWQAAEVFRWRQGWTASGKSRRRALWKSGKAVAKAVVYGSLAVLSLRFAIGSAGSSGASQQRGASGVLGWPGGRYLVAIAALVMLGLGARHVWRGVTSRFLKEIDLTDCSPRVTTLVTRVGQVGFPGKGIALGVVGGLFGYAALTFDPEKATGLDAAMRTILGAPYGRWLVTLVAVGIAAFGGFLLLRARFPERT